MREVQNNRGVCEKNEKKYKSCDGKRMIREKYRRDFCMGMNRILPILFKFDMVRAILDDRKGATRRIVKGFIPDDAIWGYTEFTPKGYISCRGIFADGYGEKFFKLPCEPGDILYVRETFDYLEGWKIGDPGIGGKYFYRADGDLRPVSWRGKRNPSLHMPKEAARIFLKVTNVCVERLQDITEDGIRREGVVVDSKNCTGKFDYVSELFFLFQRLWNSTIKKSDLDSLGWDANPWVWVIEFGLCDKPSEPYQQNGE